MRSALFGDAEGCLVGAEGSARRYGTVPYPGTTVSFRVSSTSRSHRSPARTAPCGWHLCSPGMRCFMVGVNSQAVRSTLSSTPRGRQRLGRISVCWSPGMLDTRRSTLDA